MPRIRLVVVDIDGTLVGASGEPSSGVCAAIRDTLKDGVQIALCTGRPLASAGPIAAGLGLHGPHIAFNGALVKDPQAPTAIFRQPLPAPALDRIIGRCRQEDLCLELYTQETHFVERDWVEAQRHAESIRVVFDITSFDQFFGRTDIIKAQIITADARARDAAARLAAEFAGTLRFSVAIPVGPAEGMECVNVVREGISKGTAVSALTAWYELDRQEVAGVGDALNDLPMLEAVGLRIAMGNAEPALKAQADWICGKVEDDGLAEALREIRSGRFAPSD